MRSFRVWPALVGATLLSALCGCDPSVFLNPDFAIAAGLSDGAASLPGEAPTLLVSVENRTARPVNYLLTWRNDDGSTGQREDAVRAGQTFSTALPCPVSEVTLGQIGDSSSVGAAIVLGDGNAGDPLLAVEPFGRVLQEGVNYNCGDSVTFSVIGTGATASGYQIYAFIRPG